MASIQIFTEGRAEVLFLLTHEDSLCQTRVYRRKMVQEGEIRGKVPLMILNQTQPFPVPRARAAQHSPYMVMVFAWRESLPLWIWTPVGRIPQLLGESLIVFFTQMISFYSIKLINCLLDCLSIYTNTHVYIHSVCMWACAEFMSTDPWWQTWLLPCGCRWVAVLRGKTVVPWHCCCYGY